MEIQILSRLMTVYRLAIAAIIVAAMITTGFAAWRYWVRESHTFRIWYDKPRLHFTGTYDHGTLFYRAVQGYPHTGDYVDDQCALLLRIEGREVTAHEISPTMMQELGAVPTFESGPWQVWDLRSKNEGWNLSASFNSGRLRQVCYFVDTSGAYGAGETETPISLALRGPEGGTIPITFPIKDSDVRELLGKPSGAAQDLNWP